MIKLPYLFPLILPYANFEAAPRAFLLKRLSKMPSKILIKISNDIALMLFFY